jgi:hypothetical protein
MEQSSYSCGSEGESVYCIKETTYAEELQGEATRKLFVYECRSRSSRVARGLRAGEDRVRTEMV